MRSGSFFLELPISVTDFQIQSRVTYLHFTLFVKGITVFVHIEIKMYL